MDCSSCKLALQLFVSSSWETVATAPNWVTVMLLPLTATSPGFSAATVCQRAASSGIPMLASAACCDFVAVLREAIPRARAAFSAAKLAASPWYCCTKIAVCLAWASLAAFCCSTINCAWADLKLASSAERLRYLLPSQRITTSTKVPSRSLSCFCSQLSSFIHCPQNSRTADAYQHLACP